MHRCTGARKRAIMVTHRMKLDTYAMWAALAASLCAEYLSCVCVCLCVCASLSVRILSPSFFFGIGLRYLFWASTFWASSYRHLNSISSYREERKIFANEIWFWFFIHKISSFIDYSVDFFFSGYADFWISSIIRNIIYTTFIESAVTAAAAVAAYNHRILLLFFIILFWRFILCVRAISECLLNGVDLLCGYF